MKKSTVVNLKKEIVKDENILELLKPVETKVVEQQYYTPAPETEGFIKAGLHVEKLKFGNKPESKNKQIDIFSMLDEGHGKTTDQKESDKNTAVEYNISIIGIENTLAQNKALYAIQTLLSETDYKGNSQGREISDTNNVFYFTGYIPALKMTIPEYLDAYGVKKNDKGRGWAEYLSNERKEALEALRELHEKKYMIYYSRFNGKRKNGEPLFDVISTVRPLITITTGYQNLTEDEVNNRKLPEEKLTHLVIEPSAILIDQIDKHFTMKPANLYQEIKIAFGKVDKKLALFIDYLITTATERSLHKEKLDFEITLDNLAYKLRLDYLITSRQQKRLYKQLNGYFEQSKILEYIKDFKIITGNSGEKVIFKLNEKKYYRTKAFKESQDLETK